MNIEIRQYSELESTNKTAMNLAENGALEGTIVVAKEQVGGRGRLSRVWTSPKGGLWFSVILRPHVSAEYIPQLTLLAGNAVVSSLRKIARKDCIYIKWPNDVLYEGKKLVGILTEMNAEMDCINYIIIGMGINVNIDKEEMPEEIQNIATSLSQITGKKISRLKLLNKILYYLEHLYIICQEEGFAPILDEWRKYSITLNQHIRVIGTNEVLEGIAVDIDDDGALLVNIDGQIKRVLAGDVSIRPVQNR